MRKNLAVASDHTSAGFPKNLKLFIAFLSALHFLAVLSGDNVIAGIVEFGAENGTEIDT